jgi:DHA2 family multidrug resistance protein
MIYHHAVLSESISTYDPNTLSFTAILNSLGITGGAVNGQLEQILTQQAYMMATNDFFRISCLAFLVLAGLVWMTKPRRGAAASMGH